MDGQKHDLTKNTILVVEDDEEVRNVTGFMLSQLGYEVLKAGNASAALELLESGKPVHLLFADVGLPDGMNGTQLATEARQRHAELKVLLVSAYDEQTLRGYGAFAVGGDVLRKPYDQEKLAQAVEKCLREGG